MAEFQMNRAVLPLLKGMVVSNGRGEAGAFLGSATVINGLVCTCAHVVHGIELGREFIVTKWEPHVAEAPYVVFDALLVHPKFDFAVLLPRDGQRCPLEPVPLRHEPFNFGPQVCVVGFHDDGTVHDERGRTQQVAPRMFSGNIVRTNSVGTNFSAAVCELSFPVLSGFSGAPVMNYPNPNIIAGMAYGNVEQKIQVYATTEVRDGQQVYTETVNRILDLGLFHSASNILSYLRDMGLAKQIVPA